MLPDQNRPRPVVLLFRSGEREGSFVPADAPTLKLA
ncbi:hypothetical protein L195_g048701, partial [Trifolium pratense]